MVSKEELLKALGVYGQHVKNYDQEFRRKGKLPKNYEWRPYRWCSRDIVFSLLAVRHSRHGNYLEVDVCMIANPPQYVENSGAKVALGFLLSEAYKCGGSMEIVFTKNVEGGRVPAGICDLAIEMGVKLKHVFEGHITPFESRQMYISLVGFSQAASEKVMKLAIDSVLPPERVCFLVTGGVWTVYEAESIILSSDHPERILMTQSDPSERHLYLNDILISRMAILGGSLDRKLLKPELVVNGQIVESEDEETQLTIGFDEVYFAKIYQSEVEVPIPWCGETDRSLKPGQQLVCVVRSRSDAEVLRGFDNDFAELAGVVEKYRGLDDRLVVVYLLPRDFEDVPLQKRKEMLERLKQIGVTLMMSPESVAALDKEAIRRLETGRMVRQ